MLSQTDATSDQPAYLMLDELVYTDSWDLWLKTFFDDAWPVRVAATSSATAALREPRLESGVGRWSEQHLTPYLFGEFLDLIDEDVELDAGTTLAATIRSLPAGQRAAPRHEVARRAFMLVGGFPELLSTRTSPSRSDSTTR